MGAAQAQRLVVCRLDDQRFALPVTSIERVLPAMSCQPPPQPSPWLGGIAHVHGEAVPVLDIRRRLSCDAREPHPDDLFVLASRSGRRVGFFVDAIEDIVDAGGRIAVHELDRLFPPQPGQP
jgi:purine-binding chemotaxis protein CheW